MKSMLKAMVSKKSMMFVLTFLLVFSVPLSTALAADGENVISPMGAGEWDYLGSSTFVTTSAQAKSAGGDFLICLESGPSGYYNLYEYDPDNADDRVGYVYLYPGACGAFRSIGGFVDGDNKRAEFYVYKAFGGTATISFYD